MNKSHTSKIKKVVLASSLTALTVLMSSFSFAQTVEVATTHVIKKGDSINEIAKKYASEQNLSFDAAYRKLIAANPAAYAKGNPDLLIIGAKLVLPATSASTSKTPAASTTPEVTPAQAAPVVAPTETPATPTTPAVTAPVATPASTATMANPAASASVEAPTASATPAAAAPATPAVAASTTSVVNWDSMIVMPIWAICLLGIALLMLLVRLLRRKPAPILDIDGNEVEANATPPKVNITLPSKENPTQITAAKEPQDAQISAPAHVVEPVASGAIERAQVIQPSHDDTVPTISASVEKIESDMALSKPEEAPTKPAESAELSNDPVKQSDATPEHAKPNKGITFATADLAPVGLTAVKSNADSLQKSTFRHIDLAKFGIPVAKLNIFDQVEETKTDDVETEKSSDELSNSTSSPADVIDSSLAASIIPTEPLTLPEVKAASASDNAADETIEDETDSEEISTEAFRRVPPVSLPELNLGTPTKQVETDSTATSKADDNHSENTSVEEIKPIVTQHADSSLNSTAFMTGNDISQGNKSVAVAVKAATPVETVPVESEPEVAKPVETAPVETAAAEAAPVVAKAVSSGVDLDVSGFMRRFSHQVPPEPMPPAIDFEDLLDRTHLQAWLNQRTPEEVLMCAQDAHDENYDDIAEVMLGEVLFRGDAEQCSVAARLRRLWSAQRYR